MTIDEIYHGVHLDDERKNNDATQSCRKTLSRERNPPIDDVIQVWNRKKFNLKDVFLGWCSIPFGQFPLTRYKPKAKIWATVRFMQQFARFSYGVSRHPI